MENPRVVAFSETKKHELVALMDQEHERVCRHSEPRLRSRQQVLRPTSKLKHLWEKEVGARKEFAGTAPHHLQKVLVARRQSGICECFDLEDFCIGAAFHFFRGGK